MNVSSRKRYGGIIGIGLLYMWACALLVWADMWTSVFGFLGMILVNIAGIAIAFYTTSLEQDVKDLSKRLEICETGASYWESQANLAFDKIESLGDGGTRKAR